MSDIYALRGAITSDDDSPEMIDSAVKEMMDALFEYNGISESDLVSVLFSQTKDLRSRNAAAACRKAGYCASVPLFCVQEADVDGGLEKAIRVLITVRGCNESPRMAYLKGASMLRPDLKK